MANSNNFPKITVITPVKNGGKTLEKAILSLIGQNYPNLEYIVIDGNSSDNTVKIIKKYENYINYWHSKDDGGAAVASIEGIKKSSGQIIAFLNSDDFYEKDVLLKIGQEFIKNPDLDIISTKYRVLNIEGKVIDESDLSRMELNKNKIIISYGINARFFQKKLFDEYGYMMLTDEKGKDFYSNDIEHLLRLLFKGINNKTLDIIGYNYVSHEKSHTFSTNIENKKRLWNDKIFIAKRFLNSNEFDIPKIWLLTFKKWQKKYRSLIVIYYLKNKDYSKTWENFKNGVKDNGFFAFLFYLIKSFFRKTS